MENSKQFTGNNAAILKPAGLKVRRAIEYNAVQTKTPTILRLLKTMLSDILLVC